ncbi:MAG: restriction endonuclease subunit S [Thiovulaceae bacterium]|nr:restriction endonuclease subunit S [Sulfurimonadaceae bacterium]
MSELYELPDGWELKRLDTVSTFINGRAYKKDELLDSGKYPVLRVGNFFTNNNWYYSDLELPSDKYCDAGDLLYAWSASFGPRIWEGDKSIYHYHIWKVIPNFEFILKDYLYQFLSWDTEKIKSDKGTGTTMVHITKGSIEERIIPLPPLPEQQRIVSKLDLLFEKIDRSIALHVSNMNEADAFMGSVLNDVFGELEEKYELKILGDLTKTTSGGTPKRNEKSYWGGNIGWLKSGELNDGYITEVEEFITEDGLKKSSAKLFPKGTLLIAMYGATVGRLGILEFETTTNQAICGILNDKNQFETLYMFYFLRKIREKMLKDSFGGAQPNISQTYIKELELPLPPLQIQQKTVAYLDEISLKIEKIKQLQKEKMNSLKALKASILDSAFRGEL